MEIEIIPADENKDLKVSWTITETIGDAVVNTSIYKLWEEKMWEESEDYFEKTLPREQYAEKRN